MSSAIFATSTATTDFSSQPARSLIVSGIFTAVRTARKISPSNGKSRSKPEPPHFTTFFAGQPKLISTASKPRSSTIFAASAITAGFAPKSCAVMGCSSSWKKRYRRVFFALRVMPSELVNSVISRPQPPRPRMTRRKSVSVTPAMGARTAAGRMVRSRIWKLAGIIYLSLGWCARGSKTRLAPWVRNRLAGGILIRAWRGAGERENRSGKQQRVRKVVDPLNLDRGAGVGHLRDQDRHIDEQDQQHHPGTEISCRHPRLLGQQNARTSNEKNCARQIANEQAPRNPRGRQFFERDSGASRRVQKMLKAKKYGGDGDQHAAHGDELALALPAHCGSRKNPGSARERHFADDNRPWNPVTGAGENSRDMHHGHKKKHHDPEQQAGPAHLNFCGHAQGRSQQRKAHEIRPKQWPWHIRGHAEHDESCAREMLRAEHRQGDGETQFAQGYDLVQAAGPAHRNDAARDLKKCGENDCVHVDAWRKPASSI